MEEVLEPGKRPVGSLPPSKPPTGPAPPRRNSSEERLHREMSSPPPRPAGVRVWVAHVSSCFVSGAFPLPPAGEKEQEEPMPERRPGARGLSLGPRLDRGSRVFLSERETARGVPCRTQRERPEASRVSPRFPTGGAPLRLPVPAACRAE